MFMIKLMTSPAKIYNPQPFILAVSGGVDSVVMLDWLSQKYDNLVVAHFEHGIRGEASLADARFVRALAKKYHLPYEIASGDLGGLASEDEARRARYQFLRAVARERHGLICTAHHADDVLESIAINCKRGTGWRGLAVMGAPDIYRPLLTWTKAQILQYALEHKLEWREDETNHQPIYLRNTLRQQIQTLPVGSKELLFELFERQTILRQAIERILVRMVNQSGRYRRYRFIMAEDSLAREMLTFVTKWHTGVSLTRPQAERAILAIKTARQGETHQLVAGAKLVFSTSSFVVKTDKK